MRVVVGSPPSSDFGATRQGGGGFGGLEPLHRNNLHFTEEFLTLSRYKAVTRGYRALQAGLGVETLKRETLKG